ncbi:sulfite exporter TauE/SafE family protein [Candidatus Microgenomates bacterium]|nr:sulfite exporter TauE/SafE family protein [Candidatus Microgenomates bacterium]
MNLWTIFLTGLLTGGLTCLAVQGGLLATTIAQAENRKSISILTFLIAKLVAYSILGFLLGWFGSFFQMSITTRVILQIAVGIFMIGTALNFLDVHPIFRYFLIQPPKFLTRLIRRQSKNQNLFTPIILGAFTIFLPCGTTQAMMALSIASGNPLTGGIILFAFILGTTPLFFILGFLATRLSQSLNDKFLKAVAFVIIILAVFNINSAIVLTGSPYNLENITRDFWCTVTFCPQTSQIPQDVNNEPTIYIEDSGYRPSAITVKAGSVVTLKLINTSRGGCQQAFTIPQLGIQKIVPPGTSEEIRFTAPDTPGEMPFMCTMGMYRGKIIII